MRLREHTSGIEEMPWVEVEGTTLFYREAGKGRLALFIHGFPLDNTLWIDQIEGLRHVRRCVAVDLRGHGRSAPPHQPVLTMEAMAADVAALIEALGEHDADVVGLSMGGYVALALVSGHPERIRTLTLMDTRASADSDAARSGRDALIARLLASGRSVIADEMIETLLGADPSQRAVARLRAMVEGTRYETFTAVLHGMKRRLDRTALLGSIEVPSLVIGGDQDTLIPVDEAHALAAAIPGARTTIVRGAGHLPPIEQPDQVNGALMEHFEGRKVVWWRRS